MLDKRSEQKQLQTTSNGRSSMFLLRKTENSKLSSPSNLDHLGFKGLYVLQEGLHGLPCVYHGLMGREEHLILTDEFNKVINNHSTSKHQRT